MKEIICDKGIWGGSINFVDINNVLVGYELGGETGGDAGYSYVSSKFDRRDFCGYNILMGEELHLTDEELDKYVFDIKADTPNWIPSDVIDGNYEIYDLNLILFKLYNPNDENDIIYLVIYNIHNGYYTNGFIIQDNDKVIENGRL